MSRYGHKILISHFLGILLLSWSSHVFASSPFFLKTPQCVQIYYDAPSGPILPYGQIYAQLLVNLLGHFPQLSVNTQPIEFYQEGDIDRCPTTFYIGSFFDNAIPSAFLADYASGRQTVVWMGYSIWQLTPEQMMKSLGINYLNISDLDGNHLDQESRPTFFKNVNYKGEVFEKYGEFDFYNKSAFNSAHEITRVEVNSPETIVLADIEHNYTHERAPYVLRKGSRYFVADIPFSYIHESDRYLVFADLLFDFLGERPVRTNSYPAVFRLEDVNARTLSRTIVNAVNIAKKHNVPIHIASIPIFTDPYGVIDQPADDSWRDINAFPTYKKTLLYAQANGAKFIWHGVTHQYSPLKNPSGAVGNDFEFWDVNIQTPVGEDSVSFVLDRLNKGWQSYEAVGIRPLIWEVPHYQASALDYLLFARVFKWNIGRIGYQLFTARNLVDIPPVQQSELYYSQNGIAGHSIRQKYLGALEVTTHTTPQGQFFPYEIYRDVYGQRVIPENLGNVQAPDGRPTRLLRTVDQMLRDARHNRVLRDVWGSFYYHPQLLETMDGRRELERLLVGLKDLGYEFVNLEDLVKSTEI